MTHKIDWPRLQTAEDRALAAMHDRARALKIECTNRIRSVLDPHTLANLQSAAIVGRLTPAEMESFRLGQQWIEAMLSTCRSAASSDHDPAWPEADAALVALAARY